MMPGHFGGGFDGPFGGAPPFFVISFIIIFTIVIGGIIFTIGAAIRNGVKNASLPIIAVEARIIAKRTEVSTRHSTDNDGISHNSSTSYYYMTFETEHGERLELAVSGRIFGLLIEGDRGKLVYQGTWFKDFQRNQSLSDEKYMNL